MSYTIVSRKILPQLVPRPQTLDPAVQSPNESVSRIVHRKRRCRPTFKSITNCPHTEKPHYSKGYCRSCYHHVWHASKSLRKQEHVDDANRLNASLDDGLPPSNPSSCLTDHPLASSTAPQGDFPPSLPSATPPLPASLCCPHPQAPRLALGMCAPCYFQSTDRWWAGLYRQPLSYTVLFGEQPEALPLDQPLGLRRAERWVLPLLGQGAATEYRHLLRHLLPHQLSDKRLSALGVSDAEHRRTLLAHPPLFSAKPPRCGQCGESLRHCHHATQEEAKAAPGAKKVTHPRKICRCALCGQVGHNRQNCSQYQIPNYAAFDTPESLAYRKKVKV